MMYHCTGCGRMTEDPEADMLKIRAAGGIACCPERNMKKMRGASLKDALYRRRAEKWMRALHPIAYEPEPELDPADFLATLAYMMWTAFYSHISARLLVGVPCGSVEEELLIFSKQLNAIHNSIALSVIPGLDALTKGPYKGDA